MEIYYILDASAFINGFKPTSKNNFTVPEITAEIKDFKSRLAYDSAVDDGILTVQDVSGKYLDKTDEIISKSGDVLRLSIPDKKIIALAVMLKDEGKPVKVISDDYTIQNTLKIMDIAYDGIITEGIREIYNWKKVSQGCKKEFEEDYPFDDCDVCGSKVYKKRIKVSK